MPTNKDIAIRLILGIIFLFFSIKIFGPFFSDFVRRKLFGDYKPNNDIDGMIRRQKELLRAQYGLQTQAPLTPPTSREIEKLLKETRWGGGEFIKNIQIEINKSYSYTLEESQINHFIIYAEKNHYLHYLNPAHQESFLNIKNFLCALILNLLLIEEIKNNERHLIELIANKYHISSQKLLLALQIKILYSLAPKKNIKEEDIFCSQPNLRQYSTETLNGVIATFAKEEADLWAKGHSIFFQSLTPYFIYADILIPIPAIKNRKDIDSAHRILKTNDNMSYEEIKKSYKKLAMQKHPDKIGQMNLPKFLEKKAILQFNQIQDAYEIISTHKK